MTKTCSFSDETAQELAAKHKIHPMQVTAWSEPKRRHGPNPITS